LPRSNDALHSGVRLQLVQLGIDKQGVELVSITLLESLYLLYEGLMLLPCFE
jgi:hypothetical protein